MKLMTTIGLASLLAISAISLTASAGKEDREFKDKELMPAVKAAAAKFKSSCGCALAITIDDATMKTKDDYIQAKHMADWVTDGVGGYCTDAASKKAVCQMKSLVLAKAAEAKFTFKGGKGVATTDGQSSTTFEMMTQELDK